MKRTLAVRCAVRYTVPKESSKPWWDVDKLGKIDHGPAIINEAYANHDLG
jgi:hypothetical protein